MSTVADTTFIHNRAPLHRDTAHLEEIRSLGMRAGPEEYTFGQIGAFTVDSRGRIFVAEVGGEVRQYDSAGAFLRTIGRQGEGPGEVRGVVGMVVLPTGELVVRDLGNGRFSVYGSDGDFRRQWKAPEGLSGHGNSAIDVDSSGLLYFGVNPPLPRDNTPLEFPRPIFVELTSNGQVLDTLFAAQRYTEHCNVQSSWWFRRGWFEDVRVFYQPKVKWAISSDGSLVIGCPADYSFDIVETSGRVLRVSREWAPIEVSSAELDNFRESLTISSNRSGYYDSWQWHGPDLPGILPAYQRFVPAEDGRIWVWPTQRQEKVRRSERARLAGFPDEDWQDPMTGAFDVFEADGRFLGSVLLPENLPYTFYPATPDPFIRGDTLWAVTIDSLDVQYLTEFEVAWPSE